MSLLSLIMIAAFLCEALIETFKTLYENGKINWNRVVAIALGIVICWAYNVDLFQLLGLTSLTPIVGTILTGVIISRGANFIHDFFRTLEGIKDSVK